MLVTSGRPSLAQAEQAVAEHLVVVHHVEVAAARAQLAQRPQAEGERLGERAGPHRRDLEHVDPVAVLAQAAGCGTGPRRGTGPGSGPRAAPGRAQAPGRAGRRTPRRGGRARPAHGSGAGRRRPGRRSAACSGRTAARPGAGGPAPVRQRLARTPRRSALPRRCRDPVALARWSRRFAPPRAQPVAGLVEASLRDLPGSEHYHPVRPGPRHPGRAAGPGWVRLPRHGLIPMRSGGSGGHARADHRHHRAGRLLSGRAPAGRGA